jgi:hypothetical protein
MTAGVGQQKFTRPYQVSSLQSRVTGKPASSSMDMSPEAEEYPMLGATTYQHLNAWSSEFQSVYICETVIVTCSCEL